ncbi:MAG: hypothetical protein PVF15_02595 [Candidatus Bathyarchaeota archaeon]
MSVNEISGNFGLYPPLEPLGPFDPFEPFFPKRRRPMPKRPFEKSVEDGFEGERPG